jgi:hypothetical protein
VVALNIGPAVVDLTGVRAGDRNAVHVALTANGVPMDLTGQTVTAQARKTEADASSVDAVIESLNGPAGTFTLRWPGDSVRALFVPPNVKWSGVWDLQLQDTAAPTTDPVTVVAGKFDAVLDVTRVGAAVAVDDPADPPADP